MKQLSKRILKHPLTRLSLSFLISLWLRFIYATSRKKYQIDEAILPITRGEQQAIYCFWHGNMIMQPFMRPKNRVIKVLISHHNDGEFIADIIRWFNTGTVRGSSRKGGSAALRELLRVVKQGDIIAITPDGPRGPAYEVAGGAAWLARRMKLPIVPLAFGASRGRYFNSWDRFFLPKAFSTLTYIGMPLIRPEDYGSDEALSAAIKASLLEAMRQAGHSHENGAQLPKEEGAA